MCSKERCGSPWEASRSFFNLAIGIWMVFVGILHILIHFGGYQTFAEKVSKHYQKLTTEETPP